MVSLTGGSLMSSHLLCPKTKTEFGVARYSEVLNSDWSARTRITVSELTTLTRVGDLAKWHHVSRVGYPVTRTVILAGQHRPFGPRGRCFAENNGKRRVCVLVSMFACVLRFPAGMDLHRQLAYRRSSVAWQCSWRTKYLCSCVLPICNHKPFLWTCERYCK